MRRHFLHLLVAVLTFVIGTVATLFLKGLLSPSSEITRNSALVISEKEQIVELRTTLTAISNRCGCNESFTEFEAADEEAVARAPISGGILNGRAISLPQPPYPPIAKAARASGPVAVRIVVDEQGCIESARAESGHPLLQQAAVQAAYQACFPPTRLSGEPVKVSGIVTYNFVLK